MAVGHLDYVISNLAPVLHWMHVHCGASPTRQPDLYTKSLIHVIKKWTLNVLIVV